MGSGVILKSKTVNAKACLNYPLSQPTSVVTTGIDSQVVLDQTFRVAKVFRAFSTTEISTLLKATSKAAERGEYELLKTSAHFDSTAKHPEWLRTDTKQVKDLGANPYQRPFQPPRDDLSDGLSHPRIQVCSRFIRKYAEPLAFGA